MTKRFVVNTVHGMPEPEFRARWVSMLWHAMAKTGKGYPRPTTKRNGRGERRADKVGYMATKLARTLMQRVQVA